VPGRLTPTGEAGNKRHAPPQPISSSSGMAALAKPFGAPATLRIGPTENLVLVVLRHCVSTCA
jgi:hypothetical protein